MWERFFRVICPSQPDSIKFERIQHQFITSNFVEHVEFCQILLDIVVFFWICCILLNFLEFWGYWLIRKTLYYCPECGVFIGVSVYECQCVSLCHWCESIMVDPVRFCCPLSVWGSLCRCMHVSFYCPLSGTANFCFFLRRKKTGKRKQKKKTDKKKVSEK